MLVLENAVNCVGPIIPEKLKEKIRIVANYALNEREARLFALAINTLEKQFTTENKSDIRRVLCIVTNAGKYTLSMDEEQLGSHVEICCYAAGKWREKNYNDVQVLTIILEEFCHHFWGIEDEEQVKYKVLEVIQRIVPELGLSDIYNV